MLGTAASRYYWLMSAEDSIAGLGTVSIRAIANDYSRPKSSSIYDEWGEMALEAMTMEMSRWLIEVVTLDGKTVAVGDLSAHAVWYGPTPGSKAMNIGISLVEEYRGKGIGAIAQRLLAAELHRLGIVRVEAQTDIENIFEQRALKKAGFTFEGVALKAQFRADGPHDLQVWSHISK